ncbi:hypothetical protein AX16_004065 [Volvariella volvacea WC 439]|nr:hypothetical protein AX16_004065 [Volvariella volvacea WC 439]
MLLSLSDANSFRSVDALAKLRLYNASKPISKLPAELIIEILTILVDEAQGNVAGTHDRVTGWIPATQFCAQWRKVALRSRGLWTRVWMKKLDLFKVFLERSVDQPLHIDTWRGRVNDTEYDEMFRHLVANMFRIRTLYLWQDLTGHRLSWLQGRRARQLESLRLHRIGLVLAPNNRRSATSSIAPDPSIMPKLRRLEVMSCVQEDWTPLLPSHLSAVTHLTIECFTQADQLDLLKRCYNVRRLSIRLINNRPDSGFQPPRMMLRHLTHLYLDSLSWATLKQATLPSIRHVRLTPRFGFATRESVFAACHAVKEIMGRIINQVPTSRLDHFKIWSGVSMVYYL